MDRSLKKEWVYFLLKLIPGSPHAVYSLISLNKVVKSDANDRGNMSGTHPVSLNKVKSLDSACDPCCPWLSNF